MSCRIKKLLIIFMLSICSANFTTVAMAENDQSERPHIGLVLGGGGARGAAHIGVLQALEDLKIPVDAVTGTSVGAIIGGLYASGMSPDQIEQAIINIDWPAIFSDDLARPKYSFRRKEDDFRFLIDFEVGLRSGRFRLPKGLVQGQKITQFLRQQVWPVFNINDFDRLPTPFRAVATDLKSGQAIILKNGDLATAIRASMAVPGVFAPAEIDDYLLVDGGLVSNLPVQVMRDMDVDILIVVDVGYPLYNHKPIESALDVTARMTTIFISQRSETEKHSLVEQDTLIRPELGDIGSSDFLRVAEAVGPGRSAVEQLAEKLRSFSVSSQEYVQYLNKRQTKRLNQLPELDFIRIDSDSRVSSKYISGVTRIEVGQQVNMQSLAEDANRIYGLGLFERVDVSVVSESEQSGVLIQAKRKSWGPHYLNLGISLENDFEGGSDYNISARYTRTELNSRAAEWRNDIQVGINSIFLSEFYQPLSRRSPFFMAPRIEFSADQLNTFNDGDRVAELRQTERTFGLDIGRELGSWGEVRLGFRRGDGFLRLRTGDTLNPVFSDADFDIGRYFLQIAYDKLNNVRFPKKGMRLRWQSEFSETELGADNSFEIHRFDLLAAKTFREHNTIATRWLLGATPGQDDDDTLEAPFQLGGFLSLSGLQQNELTGRYRGLGSLIYYRRVVWDQSAITSRSFYVGSSLEWGNVWQRRSEIDIDNTLAAASVFVGMDTFLGPLYLAAGRTENDDTAFYFFLGQNF